jgi:hypothetical protein
MRGKPAELLAMTTVLAATIVAFLAVRWMIPSRYKQPMRHGFRPASLARVLPVGLASLIGLFGLTLLSGRARGTYFRYVAWDIRLALPFVTTVLLWIGWSRVKRPQMFEVVGYEEAARRLKILMPPKLRLGFACTVVVSAALGILWAGRYP